MTCQRKTKTKIFGMKMSNLILTLLIANILLVPYFLFFFFFLIIIYFLSFFFYTPDFRSLQVHPLTVPHPLSPPCPPCLPKDVPTPYISAQKPVFISSEQKREPNSRKI